MKPFQASSPSVEVNGETICSVLAGMSTNMARAQRMLAGRGIQDPRPGQWYRQQAWLDAFKDIAELLGPNTLYVIGRKIPESAKFPPAIDTIDKALAAIDVAYQMNHRGGDIGCYAYQSEGPRGARMVSRNPYPCDFDRGIITAMAERFKPQGSFLVIEHDAHAPCRQKGGESCTYKVSW